MSSFNNGSVFRWSIFLRCRVYDRVFILLSVSFAACLATLSSAPSVRVIVILESHRFDFNIVILNIILLYVLYVLWESLFISLKIKNNKLVSILPDDNTNLFAASLLVSYYSFPSLILSSTIMISLYIPSKRFSLKCKELSDARVI